MVAIAVMHMDMLLELFKRHSSKKLCICLGFGMVLGKVFISWYRRYSISRNLKKKKEKLLDSYHVVRESLPPPDHLMELLPLAELELSELKRRLQTGEVKPVDLLSAFQAKAISLYDEGSSGICEFIREAEKMVKELKPFKEESKTDFSPLHGVPISVKETLCFRGYDSTAGLIKRCNMTMKKHGTVVETLIKRGAIPFVLTSTTQANRSLDGFNTVFGNVDNPCKPSHIPGGSSSGECALIAKKGSPVGIGSDIAGSIRIPAAFCGLSGLKPTTNRLSSAGMLNIYPTSVFYLMASPGPIGWSVEDLADVMRTLLSPIHFQLDSSVIPMPFDESAYAGQEKEKLVIGFYDTFDDAEFVPTMPSVREVLCEATAILEKAGHKVVPFCPPKRVEARDLIMRCLFFDGGKELRRCLVGEPLSSHLRFLNILLGLPNWIKYMGDIFLGLGGYQPLAFSYTLTGLRSATETLPLVAAIRNYQAKFQLKWNKAGPLDALICPVSAFPAPLASDRSMFVSPSIIYTSLYNLLDYPAGVVPIGRVDNAVLLQTNDVAIDYRLSGNFYDAQVALMQRHSEGLPLSVQVVGKRFHEETVLRVMRIIESGRSS